MYSKLVDKKTVISNPKHANVQCFTDVNCALNALSSRQFYLKIYELIIQIRLQSILYNSVGELIFFDMRQSILCSRKRFFRYCA